MDQLNRTRKRLRRLLNGHFPDINNVGANEWSIRNQSSITFVEVSRGFGVDGTLIKVNSPLTCRVPMGHDLFRWVATEGQNFPIGHVYLVPSGEAQTCELWFGHNFTAEGLGKAAILASIYPVIITSNELDDLLRDRFGGLLAGDRIR